MSSACPGGLESTDVWYSWISPGLAQLTSIPACSNGISSKHQSMFRRIWSTMPKASPSSVGRLHWFGKKIELSGVEMKLCRSVCAWKKLPSKAVGHINIHKTTSLTELWHIMFSVFQPPEPSQKLLIFCISHSVFISCSNIGVPGWQINVNVR